MAIINKATPAGETEAVSLNREWSLTTANDGDGLRYRQRFSLSIPTGGSAEGLTVEPATGMRLTAHHLVFDALPNDAPERASQTSAGNTGRRVILPYPRVIHSIRFASRHSPAGRRTELFRAEGDVVSEEPVTSYHNPTPGTGGKGFLAEHEMSLQNGSHQGVQHTNQGKVTELGSGLTDASHGLPGGELNVLGGDIVVRLKSGTHIELDNDSLTLFNLVTGPENLRVGLRLPDLDEQHYYLPVQFEREQLADIGTAMADQLDVLLQRLRSQQSESSPDALPPPLPDPLPLELVVESDAPCRFTIGQFALHYHLVQQSFPDGAAKQVLRFSGPGPTRQGVIIRVPPSALLHSATIRMSGAVERPGVTGDGSELSSLLDNPPGEGVRLDDQHRWSSPLALESPTRMEGVDLLLAALNVQTTLRLQLWSGTGENQDGELLATSEANLSAAGQTRLLRFRWPEALILQPDTYRVRLESMDGAAIWPLEDYTGTSAFTSGEDDANAVPAGKRGLARWVPASRGTDGDPLEATVTLDGEPLAAVADGKEWTFDLTATLAGNPPGETATEHQLQILASGPKPVTLYPPLLTFDPPGP